MDTQTFFQQTAVYLAAAVAIVPISKRLGFGSVLGYLAAGIVIGPALLGWVGSEAGDVMHFAEFGVVMMLFLVGLELRPAYLWKMRGPIFGLGSAQVIITACAIAGISMILGLVWQTSVAIGLTLSLSSTALVLQTLQEKNLSKTKAGRNAFSVLLFQDIAVIPMLAMFPLLALYPPVAGAGHHSSLLENVSPALSALIILVAIVAIICIGRFLSSYFFRFVARSGLPEIFTASALLLVIGIAILMTQLGLSPALGAFIAGVVLSESEYRHELESDIAPFKGLLLGIFFIAVGASIDFPFLFENFTTIVALVIGLMLTKAVILYLLAKWKKLCIDQSILFSLALAQAGEFGFVLTGLAATTGVISGETPRLLLSIVALSLALAPILFIINEKLIQPKLGTRESDDFPADEIDEENPVIIAGFGRFGHVVGRFLKTQNIETTVIEHDSEHVDLLRKLGLKVYYGDATRHDLLHSAGAEHAKVIVIALDKDELSLSLLATVKKHFPHLVTLARANSREHAYKLIENGVDHFFLEQQGSALELAITSIKELGHREYPVRRAARVFQRHEEEAVRTLAEHQGDRSEYISKARLTIQAIEQAFENDSSAIEEDKGWDNTSLKEKF